MFRHIKLLTLSATVLLALAPAVQATAIPIGPFIGDFTETWESFPEGTEANNYLPLPEGTAIFGGAATITSLQHDIAIFGVESPYGVGALVKPADGVQGMGLGSQRNDGVTISFMNPITAFGGYFAAYGSQFTFTFSDGSQYAASYNQQNTGIMQWQGWSFDQAITNVSWTGEFVAADGLQANGQRVPDGGTTAILLGLATTGFALISRRFAIL